MSCLALPLLELCTPAENLPSFNVLLIVHMPALTAFARLRIALPDSVNDIQGNLQHRHGQECKGPPCGCIGTHSWHVGRGYSCGLEGIGQTG